MPTMTRSALRTPPGPPAEAPNGRDRPALIVFADDWGRHPSSCQHLVRRLRDDFTILWANTIGTRQVRADSLTLRRGVEKLNNWRRGLSQVSERMWVVDLPMLPGLGRPFLRSANRRLVSWRVRSAVKHLGMEEPVLLTTLPYIGWLVRDVPRRAMVYYCTDDYSHWPSADGETLRRADRVFSDRADLILAASRALHASHDGAGRCRYFPHGVDYAHFASARAPGAVPEDLDRLAGPRIGFFGLIYEKLDFELLEAVARRFPAASLVMIGSVVTCPERFASLPNVHLLGPKPYEELPRYVAGLDVLLLPYLADDPMIRQSGPLKLKECLAAGKPTVSVDVPEVRALEPHVRVGTDPEAFLGHVRGALAEPADSPLVDARQRAVEQDDWDRSADRLRSYLRALARSECLETP
jgi:glycosyltransferase involved in cell wall biosynthesis